MSGVSPVAALPRLGSAWPASSAPTISQAASVEDDEDVTGVEVGTDVDDVEEAQGTPL